jgi:hypothetical protein
MSVDLLVIALFNDVQKAYPHKAHSFLGTVELCDQPAKRGCLLVLASSLGYFNRKPVAQNNSSFLLAPSHSSSKKNKEVSFLE